MKKTVAIIMILVLVLSVSACSKPVEKTEKTDKTEEAKIESPGANKYENNILMLRRSLYLLAKGNVSYDYVLKDYKFVFKETLLDKVINETVVLNFVISRDVIQKLDKEKADLEFLNTKIQLIDYKKKSKEEIDKIKNSMIEFSSKYKVKIYKRFNTNIVFSEPIEDTSGYGTHKVFFKEKLAEDILLCGWYLFDEDDKVISYNVSICENNQKSIEYTLKAKVKFKK